MLADPSGRRSAPLLPPGPLAALVLAAVMTGAWLGCGGSADPGNPDASASFDAGTDEPDSGTGELPDAGKADAGTDAGAPDSGTGEPPDAGEPSPPTTSDAEIRAETLDPVPFTLRALGIGDGIRVDALVVESCAGDVTTSLVLESVTVDCATLPVTLAADPSSDEVVDGATAHTFHGTWTPTAASTEGFALRFHVLDSRVPPLRSETQTAAFGYRAVNQQPTLGLEAGGTTFPMGTAVSNTVHLNIEGEVGTAEFSYVLADAELDTLPDSYAKATLRLTGSDASFFNILFPNDQQGMVFHEAAGFYSVVLPIAEVKPILSGMYLEVSGAAVVTDALLTVTLNDQGYQGACSFEVPDPCAKTAQATLQIVGDNTGPNVFGP